MVSKFMILLLLSEMCCLVSFVKPSTNPSKGNVTFGDLKDGFMDLIREGTGIQIWSEAKRIFVPR
jgi:hypothetical protein